MECFDKDVERLSIECLVRGAEGEELALTHKLAGYTLHTIRTHFVAALELIRYIQHIAIQNPRIEVVQ